MTGGTGAEKTITTFRPHHPELLKFNIWFLFFSNLISNKEQVFEYLSAAHGRRVIIVCYFISRDGEIGKRCRGRPGKTVQNNPIRGRDCDLWLLLQVRVLFTQPLGRVAVSLPVPKQKLLWRGVCRRRFGTSGGFSLSLPSRNISLAPIIKAACVQGRKAGKPLPAERYARFCPGSRYVREVKLPRRKTGRKETRYSR